MTITKMQNVAPIKNRAVARLNKTLDKNLWNYAAAASAAGVGLLALAPVSQAKIVYTPANDVISPHSSLLLDLNHDGIADFLVSNVYTGSSKGIAYAYMFAAGLYSSNVALGNSQNSARALPAKRRVGSSAFTFQPAPFMVARNCDGGKAIKQYGKWQNAKARYLGLQFVINGSIHFAWARFDVSDSGCKITPTLTGYAYETIPFQPILTGRTKGRDVITLAPASLRYLARGASGLSAWRRRKSVAATH